MYTVRQQERDQREAAIRAEAEKIVAKAEQDGLIPEGTDRNTLLAIAAFAASLKQSN
jgi:hypothetical protein